MNQLVQAIEQAITDLRAGRVQLADDGLAAALVQHQVESEAAAKAPPPPPPVRLTAEIAGELLEALVNHLGNPPRLHALLEELRRVI